MTRPVTPRHRGEPQMGPTDKGRPSPGGEEARVVVYQPRGVGLMHTRITPGATDYTHGVIAVRKSPSGLKTTFFL